jgi:hypothetical protein
MPNISSNTVERADSLKSRSTIFYKHMLKLHNEETHKDEGIKVRLLTIMDTASDYEASPMYLK